MDWRDVWIKQEPEESDHESYSVRGPQIRGPFPRTNRSEQASKTPTSNPGTSSSTPPNSGHESKPNKRRRMRLDSESSEDDAEEEFDINMYKQFLPKRIPRLRPRSDGKIEAAIEIIKMDEDRAINSLRSLDKETLVQMLLDSEQKNPVFKFFQRVDPDDASSDACRCSFCHFSGHRNVRNYIVHILYVCPGVRYMVRNEFIAKLIDFETRKRKRRNYDGKYLPGFTLRPKQTTSSRPTGTDCGFATHSVSETVLALATYSESATEAIEAPRQLLQLMPPDPMQAIPMPPIPPKEPSPKPKEASTMEFEDFDWDPFEVSSDDDTHYPVYGRAASPSSDECLSEAEESAKNGQEDKMEDGQDSDELDLEYEPLPQPMSSSLQLSPADPLQNGTLSTHNVLGTGFDDDESDVMVCEPSVGPTAEQCAIDGLEDRIEDGYDSDIEIIEIIPGKVRATGGIKQERMDDDDGDDDEQIVTNEAISTIDPEIRRLQIEKIQAEIKREREQAAYFQLMANKLRQDGDGSQVT